jgi:flagellar biosynthesis protein FlhF
MRVKLYSAASTQAAMDQIRAELGAEALILSTRRVAGGVEVTAALDDSGERRSAAVDPGRLSCLAHHRVPEAIIRKLEAGPLAFALSAAFRFCKLDLPGHARPLLLTGAPGAGKTLTVARLATRLVLGGVMPLVISTDGRRAGALEQLAAYTRLLGVRLVDAEDPLALKRAIDARPDGVPVLIDTPGLNPYDSGHWEEMMGFATISDATVALVLPAGLDASESAELAAASAQAGASLLIATRLDLVRRLGGVLAAAAAGLAMAEAGIGPDAAKGLKPLTPDYLAACLLQRGVPMERGA